MGKRDIDILDMLTKNGSMDVAELARILDVSSVTIRKDLDALESKGIVIRKHGSAHLRSANDIAGRLAYHYEEKVKIAKLAAEVVNNGDTVMIESGSCCALLARELFLNKRDVTVITNSAFIADYVRDIESSHVILLGGEYQHDSQVVVGPMVAEAVRNFMVDKLFIGTDGFALSSDFSVADRLRAQAVRDMTQQAEEVMVLTESEKFGNSSVVPLNITEKVAYVITDDKLEEAYRQHLEKSNIVVKCVS